MEARVDNETSRAIHRFIGEKINGRVGNAAGREIPFSVLNLDDVYDKLLKWQEFLPRVKPFYAVKCNNTPVVLRMLGALGTGFDCASKKEIEMVIEDEDGNFGVDPNTIIYAHTTKPPSHIEYAREKSVTMMTFDCVDELKKIKVCHNQAKLVLRIAVDDSYSRVPLNEKFGAKLQDVRGLLQRAQELDLNVIGVSFHVGSACQDREAYKMAIRNARQVFAQAKPLGFEMNFLDIGGGFNGRHEGQTSIEQMAIGINEALDEYFPDPQVEIIAEPGRYFVDTACTLAVNIIAKKVIQYEDNRNGLNGTFMYYISDGIYGSMSFKVYHSETYTFYPHRQREEGVQTYPSTIWGPTCDSFDKLTDIVQMPELEAGEWLLVHDIGAYSVSVTGNFNGFEKAQIYPVRKKTTECPDFVLGQLGEYSVSVLE